MSRHRGEAMPSARRFRRVERHKESSPHLHLGSCRGAAFEGTGLPCRGGGCHGMCADPRAAWASGSRARRRRSGGRCSEPLIPVSGMPASGRLLPGEPVPVPGGRILACCTPGGRYSSSSSGGALFRSSRQRSSGTWAGVVVSKKSWRTARKRSESRHGRKCPAPSRISRRAPGMDSAAR